MIDSQDSFKKNQTVQQMYTRQNELQYAAMASELAGQQAPPEYTIEYEALTQRIKQELNKKLDDMQYGAMASALSGQTLSARFEQEYMELEKAVESM